MSVSVPQGHDRPELDDLSPDEIDRLPFGVIQVDAGGRITLYNQAEARLSGRDPARVIGRDFFREVAPCTHVPAFHGRFLDGVRDGALDTGFGFVFGFDEPARVRVRMFPARASGRYWLVIHPLGTLAPSRHRVASIAQEAVERRVRAEPVDPSLCEREPIHLPGSVQPHAAMVTLDPDTFEVVASSDNLGDMVGIDADAALGRSLADLLPKIASDLQSARERGRLDRPDQPWRGTARLGAELRQFALTAHLHDDRLILELEMIPSRPEDFAAATAHDAQAAIANLRASDTLVRAADSCAADIRHMTGFQRVLVYRFDEEWNGEAIGESRDDHYPSLLGLRFPASDIPAQARALYTRAPARFVIDRDAVPAALLGEPAAGNQQIDMTFAQSRALSPVHLEYQRNLGVNGSMSVSIIVDGVLWGLVIGHHRQPHYVTPETRALAGVVTDAFALRVQELATTLAWAQQQETLSHSNALLRSLAGADDFVAALVEDQGGRALTELFQAGGAAVVSMDRVVAVGTTPDTAAIAQLVDWIRWTLPSDRRTLATADLSALWPEAVEQGGVAAGLLATFVDAERRNLLLWFRSEVISQVVWGGDPNKPVLADSETRTVLPRRSFERWVEERRGHAQPWEPWQIDAAETFATAVERVVIRQGRKIAELSAKQQELSAALAQKGVLAAEVDHRVKNSLQIVAGVLQMQARRTENEGARAALEETHARVMSVARVHDSLQGTDDAEAIDLGSSLRQLCDDLAIGVGGRGVSITLDADSRVMVPSRIAVALALITTELVINALKYAYAETDGVITVLLRRGEPEGLKLQVCDEGRGLPADWETRPRSVGGGLGMRVVQALLQQIGSRLDVESAPGQGACFTVAV